MQPEQEMMGTRRGKKQMMSKITVFIYHPLISVFLCQNGKEKVLAISQNIKFNGETSTFPDKDKWSWRADRQTDSPRTLTTHRNFLTFDVCLGVFVQAA